ncbi:MAG: twin-arginine translocase subunit TatC [Puniceicoccaceae bacterium]|nr:twin-arginine translocase subunit TatC [Puniceicoccaceae bacterium]
MNNPQDSDNDFDTYESESEEDTTAMSFLEHLEEFRWTVARSLIAFVVGVVVVVVLLPKISGFLQMPLIHAYGSVEAVEQKLITYKPMGVFSVFIQIALLGGLVLSMPFFLYFIACFIAPGLTDRERRVVRPACSAAFVLFLLGVCAAFFIILPLTLSVSVKFNQLMDFQVLLAASEYYNMVVWFSLATGAIFQFPLILAVLVFIQILRVEQLRRARRVVFVGMMIFSAFLTPGGDFLSLPLTTCILYGLYELSILVGTRIERKRSRADVDDAADGDDWGQY